MKSPIPRNRQEDVLHIYWMMLGALECYADGSPDANRMDKDLVTAAFNMLNELGYSPARPRWEEREKIKTITSHEDHSI